MVDHLRASMPTDVVAPVEQSLARLQEFDVHTLVQRQSQARERSLPQEGVKPLSIG